MVISCITDSVPCMIPKVKTPLKKELTIIEAVIPVLFLTVTLFWNITFKNGELLGSYSNQIILLIAAAIAISMGIYRKVTSKEIALEVWQNIKSIGIPILILLLVGALSGTWLVSGIIPSMVYYGLKILDPTIFLPACLIISAIISVATGSSWTTSATVGIALIGIGETLGMPTGIVAGAVISGAYFGDKMSPLSDTTNLAPAMAGADLFTHIKYMSLTTIPTIGITLVVFCIINYNIDSAGITDVSLLLIKIKQTFYITPFLFIVPAVVIVLIFFKTKPLFALGTGVVLALIVAYIFQKNSLLHISHSAPNALFTAVFSDVAFNTNNDILDNLFSSGGVKGMLSTIYLIIAAMIFGGAMDAIGALSKLTKLLLEVATSVFGLFASTVLSCLGLNIIASDQYLAIVIPGKMFKKAYEDKGLAPENLSRTLEDSGTVTSVLIPWNTCGAYQAGVLGVNVSDYFVYAIFNWLSPLTTLLYAALNIKIKQLAADTKGKTI